MNIPRQEPSPHVVRPETIDELVDAVHTARGNGSSYELVSGGTKRGLGTPSAGTAVLDLSGFSGIEFYEPEELVIKVRAGTRMSEIQAALSEKGQHLAFEPPDYGPVFGHDRLADTIGGVVACNLAGPRRVIAGSAKDSVLGLEGVNGRGEVFKCGGRTVKNVTGYDMAKLLTGSFGTLAALTSITLKVLPRPEGELTLIISGADDYSACHLLSKSLQLPVAISGAAHSGGIGCAKGLTSFRLEGVSASLRPRLYQLKEHLKFGYATHVIEGSESQAHWRDIRDLSAFSADQKSCLWRMLAPVGDAAKLACSIGGEALYDWGGNEVFVRASYEDVLSQAQRLRDRAVRAGGVADLFRAAKALRLDVGAFQPKSEALASLSARIKAMFDPAGLLNPGRLGISG